MKRCLRTRRQTNIKERKESISFHRKLTKNSSVQKGRAERDMPLKEEGITFLFPF